MSIYSEKVLWFDTETTGVDNKRNGIVQLAAIVEIQGKVVDEQVFYMNPVGKDIDPEASKINGFTKEKISKFEPALAVVDQIEDFFKKHVNCFAKYDKFWVGGQNVKFDVDFLAELWKEAQPNQPWKLFTYIRGGAYLDTLSLVATLQYLQKVPYTNDRKLLTLAKLVGLNVKDEEMHDAIADIKVTREVFYKLLNKF